MPLVMLWESGDLDPGESKSGTRTFAFSRAVFVAESVGEERDEGWVSLGREPCTGSACGEGSLGPWLGSSSAYTACPLLVPQQWQDGRSLHG